MADSSTFTAVDLSRLAAPDIVEPLSFEQIFSEMVGTLQAGVDGLFTGIPEFDATVESDPAVKVLQVGAYRETLMRARVNDAARAVMIAYAGGADLDNLAAYYGVSRLTVTEADTVTGEAAVMESDTELRRRVLLAPEGLSVAGPEGAYIFHALSADAQVLDASAILPTDANGDPEAGVVVVTLLSRGAGGTATPDLVSKVAAYLSAEDRRPLTDNLIVRSASMVPFAIEAELTVFTGPDSAIVLGQAQSQVASYLAESLRLGRDVTRYGILAAMAVAGIQNVNLISPAADLVLDRTQAGQCTGVQISIAGVGE